MDRGTRGGTTTTRWIGTMGAAALSLGAATAAHATVIATASFDTADGFAPGQMDATEGGAEQTGGTGWSTTDPWNTNGDFTKVNVVNVSANPLTYTIPGGATVSGGVQALEVKNDMSNQSLLTRDLAAPRNDDHIFISYLYRKVAFNGATTTANEKAFFWFNSNAHAGVGVDDNNQFMVRADNSSSEVNPSPAVNNALGQTFFIVGHLYKSVPGADSNYDRFALWVNPSATDESSPLVVSSATGSISSFVQVGMTVFGALLGDVALVDQLVIGTEWGDVVPVPEPASLGLLGLGGFAALARRRK